MIRKNIKTKQRRDREFDDRKKTSWGGVAKWYGKTVEDSGSYQKTVLLPNILRMLALNKSEDVLDVASGSGFFTEQFGRLTKKAVGVEIAPQLVAIAKKQYQKGNVSFVIGDAQKLPRLGSFDVVTMIMALQNIEDMSSAIRGMASSLKKGGRLLLVINHPMFRIPRQTSWVWDEEKKTQYRRIDRYMGELKIPIQMHPGQDRGSVTWSFHHPLSDIVKQLSKNNLHITDLEEWVSPKESDSGPRKKGENRAKQEIPLFMAIIAKKQ